MGLTVTSPAETAPVSVAEVRAHLRIDHTDEDELLAGYVRAATDWCENFLGRSLVTRTLRLTRPRFPGSCGAIELPDGPVASVTEIGYRDLDGADQVVPAEDYIAVLDAVVPWVEPVSGVSWPATELHPQAVRVTYVAGYGDADAVPRDIRQAILLLVGQFAEFREQVVGGAALSEVPMGVTALLFPHRVIGGTS